MTLEEDVIRIKKKLEKMMAKEATDTAAALDMLKQLRKLPMNLAVLTKTKIGVTVNQFRKSITDDEVVNLAKSIIKGWKKFLPENSSSSQGQSSVSRTNSSASNLSRTQSNMSSAAEEDSRDSASGAGSATGEGGSNSQGSPSNTPDTTTGEGDGGEHGQGEPAAGERIRRQSSSMMEVDDTTDPVRLKCRELIVKALKTPPETEGCATPEVLGESIEQTIFDEFKNTEMKYKNRVRSRVANLRDAKNPKLRQGVLIGFISPEKIAVMTAEEMASDDLKTARAKFTKEAIDEHQMAQQGGTNTDYFKCGRCGKRKCQYNQVQTRSADEPMTTFVCCMHCGNRWKFC